MKALSVGIGLTNDCDLQCAALLPSDGRDLCADAGGSGAGVRRVAGGCGRLSGRGENALHPQFLEIITDLHERGIRLSMASNGYSLNTIPTEYLSFFHDVELSIDFPDAADQDAFRGAGNWDTVQRAMARCAAAGLRTSVLATMMNVNYDRMDRLAAMARCMGANLRVNVYQPVRNGRYNLSYAEFWEGFRRLFGAAALVSCTEPVVRAVLGEEVTTTCGHESVRITPQGWVTPCVYWPDGGLSLDDLTRLGTEILDAPAFRAARQVPAVAADCACQGGCAGRRALLGELDAHDLYCPWVRGDTIRLDWTPAPASDLVRARNYCTTIVA